MTSAEGATRGSAAFARFGALWGSPGDLAPAGAVSPPPPAFQVLLSSRQGSKLGNFCRCLWLVGSLQQGESQVGVADHSSSRILPSPILAVSVGSSGGGTRRKGARVFSVRPLHALLSTTL
uniref:Uncharacterized protein n=1 Tax=Sphaerodactylus townsendi TaxID=933632 RepID=A0ACB8ECD2_9SAUR